MLTHFFFPRRRVGARDVFRIVEQKCHFLGLLLIFFRVEFGPVF